MSIKKTKINDTIREYLLEEGLLGKKISNSKSNIEFGYVFTYPPGQMGQQMSVFKPNNKDFIIIIIRMQFSKKQIAALNSLDNDKKNQFFLDLRKYFVIKEIFFRINMHNYRFEMNHQIFIKNDGIISKNSFFKGVKKIFYSFMFTNILLSEYCSGRIKSSKEGTSSFDFSLYS